MTVKSPNCLARSITDFFADHLPRLRGMSPHTVHSYRDSLVLLLRFVAATRSRSIVKLDIDDIGAAVVIAFLQHLEEVRGNGAATRNVRLAAIHAFFHFVAGKYPERLEHCQRILGVPFKRTRSRPIEYLEYEEIQAVLEGIDRSSDDGRRDFALVATMFNTGVRVQEILDLRPCDLQLVKPFQIRIFGKGRKERICPIWAQTAQLLRSLLAQCGADQQSRDPLFRNHRGEPLTRYGVRYLLAKHCAAAAASRPTLATKRLHPHSMRHSTAVHLLKSGVDLVTISQWLGHASVNTTNRYATVDLDTKRDAIAKAKPIDSRKTSRPSWRTDTTILTWLEAL